MDFELLREGFPKALLFDELQERGGQEGLQAPLLPAGREVCLSSQARGPSMGREGQKPRMLPESILLPSEGAGATPALPWCHSWSSSSPQPGYPRGWEPQLVSQPPALGWGMQQCQALQPSPAPIHRHVRLRDAGQIPKPLLGSSPKGAISPLPPCAHGARPACTD